MLRRKTRRRVIFALLALAIVGIGPGVEALRGGRPLVAHVADANPSLALANNGEPHVLPPAPAPPTIVVASSESWTKYIDLVIRVLALILAWLMERSDQAAARAR